ncbi:MAG: hypothetical protein WA827_03530 [Candidatus Binatus sp.]
MMVNTVKTNSPSRQTGYLYCRRRWSPPNPLRPPGRANDSWIAIDRGVMEYTELVTSALRLVNAVRREIGEPPLESFPPGSLEDADSRCPLAKAMTALVILRERRIVFCYPWHASAATKLWGVSFADSLLMSVTMPDALYDFATAFRRGLLPNLLE